MIDGSALVAVATAAALGAVALAGHAALRGGDRSLAWARAAMVATTALLVGAVIRLGYAFWVSDFAITYVVDQSRRDTPWPIRVAGIWGGMDGSLLLWTSMLAVATILGIRSQGSVDRRALALAVSAALVGAHAAIVLWLADPFTTLAVPAVSGGGLTPILEHPAMAIHPPVLYAGLVGFVPSFAWSVAGLTRRRGERLEPAIGRLIVWPWAILTAGIALGANWAYVELGWGGYWAWDPVENASLLPWLAGLAALHLARRGDDRLTARAALAPFAMVMIGSAVTRSGAASSVHAFADVPSIGRSLAVIAGLVIAGAVLALNLSVAGRGRLAGRDFSPDAEVLAVPPFLAAVVLVVVLIGTLYPVIASIGGIEASVGGSYYTVVAGPAAFVAALGAGYASVRGRRRRIHTAVAVWRSTFGVLAATVAFIAALAAGWPVLPTGALVGAAAWLVAVTVDDLRHRPRRGLYLLAHLGFALFLVGVAGSTASSETVRSLESGDRFTLAGHEVEFVGVTTMMADDTARVRAEVLVDGEPLYPELVSYPRRGRILAETALRSGYRDDVQIVLVRADDTGRAVIDVSVRPLVAWIWWGAVAMVVGGLGSWMAAHFSRSGRVGPEAQGAHSPAQEDLQVAPASA